MYVGVTVGTNERAMVADPGTQRLRRVFMVQECFTRISHSVGDTLGSDSNIGVNPYAWLALAMNPIKNKHHLSVMHTMLSKNIHMLFRRVRNKRMPL